MRFILLPSSAAAGLVLAVASASAASPASASASASDHRATRSLTMSTMEKARSLYRQGRTRLQAKQQRSLQDPDADLSDMFGDMDMSDMGEFFCLMMDMGMDMMDEQEGMEDMPEIDCDCSSADDMLALKCRIDEEVCDGEWGCIDWATTEVFIPLGGLMGDSDVESDVTFEVCMQYSDDDRTPQPPRGDKVCFNAVVDMDLAASFGATEAETSDLAAMLSCTASVNDKACDKCEICDGGVGVEMDCVNGHFMCTDFVTDDGTGSPGSGVSPAGGLPAGSTVSVMRLAPQAAQTSGGSSVVGTTLAAACALGLAITVSLFA